MAHEQFQSCIDACYACADACDHCAASCLQEQDVKALARCIRLDMDCAQICRLAAAYMARGSELAGAICELCARVCETCGEECARHPMSHCQTCAQACRRCADECRRMASARPAKGTGQGMGAAAH
ncbi:MAG: four-helix bundle copper-binding protein [Pseudomonadota bacterium]